MLPVPIDQLIVQPMQYPHGQPPVQLGMLQQELPQQIHQYLPMLGSLVANELVGRANMNHIRIFAFNLTAQNNYQNSYYLEAVRIAAVLFFWTTQQSGIQQASASMQHIAQKAIEMFIAKCIVGFPELQGYVDQNQYTAAIQTNGQLDNLMADVGRMTSGQGRYIPTQPQMPMSGYQPPMPGYGTQPMGGYRPPMPGYAPPSPGMGNTQFGISGQGYLGSGNARNPSEAQNTENRYSGRNINITEPSIVPMPTIPIPSTTNGVTKMPRLLEEAVTMNRSQHTITIAHVPVQRSKREFLAMERLENLGTDLRPIKLDNLTTQVYTRTLLHTNMDELTMECRVVQQQQKQDNKESQIFMARAVIGKFFVTPEDYTEELRSIVRQDSLSMIAEKLLGMCTKAGDLHSGESIHTINLIRHLNTRLTQYVNHYLRVEMDLGINIDSFMDDASGLEKFILDQYGIAYVQYLVELQKNINEGFMPNMETSETVLRENVLDNTGVCASLCLESVGITLLDLLYEELGYDLKPGSSYQIQDNHQLMKMLAHKVYYGDGVDALPTHSHYLITLDDVHLSLHKSAIYPEVYLIALADC